jgi:hypothetical protein
MWRRHAGYVSEQMGISSFAGAGLSGKDGSEWAGFVAGCIAGSPSCQAFERGLDRGKVVEGVESVGATAEFAGGLRATEEEKAEDSGFVAAEIKDGADAVLVLRDAGVADRRDEGEVFERVEGLADVFFLEVEHGVAAGALVRGVDQGVEGERVVLGGGDFLFDKGAENAELDSVKMHVYKGAIAQGSGGTDE